MGGSSRATPKRRSPAVVTAAVAPIESAMRRASSTPPRCPPRSGTANAPSSETATTGGSARLSARAGATERTRIPAAQTPHDGAPRLEELADVAGRLGEPHVRVAGPFPESVHLHVAEGVRYPAREPAALRGDGHYRDGRLQLHATLRPWARTTETWS